MTFPGWTVLNDRSRRRKERFKQRVEILMREGMEEQDARLVAHALEKLVAEFHRNRNGQTP